MADRLARLRRRLADAEWRHPRRRVFRAIVERETAAAEVAAFRREHGVTDTDLLIVRVLMPEPATTTMFANYETNVLVRPASARACNEEKKR